MTIFCPDPKTQLAVLNIAEKMPDEIFERWLCLIDNFKVNTWNKLVWNNLDASPWSANLNLPPYLGVVICNLPKMVSFFPCVTWSAAICWYLWIPIKSYLGVVICNLPKLVSVFSVWRDLLLCDLLFEGLNLCTLWFATWQNGWVFQSCSTWYAVISVNCLNDCHFLSGGDPNC